MLLALVLALVLVDTTYPWSNRLRSHYNMVMMMVMMMMMVMAMMSWQSASKGYNYGRTRPCFYGTVPG